MHSRSSFRQSIGSQHVNRFHTLQNSAEANFYLTFSSFRHRYTGKMFFLVRPEVLRLYLNPLSADARYSHHNLRNLPQPIQMHLL